MFTVTVKNEKNIPSRSILFLVIPKEITTLISKIIPRPNSSEISADPKRKHYKHPLPAHKKYLHKSAFFEKKIVV